MQPEHAEFCQGEEDPIDVDEPCDASSPALPLDAADDDCPFALVRCSPAGTYAKRVLLSTSPSKKRVVTYHQNPLPRFLPLPYLKMEGAAVRYGGNKRPQFLEGTHPAVKLVLADPHFVRIVLAALLCSWSTGWRKPYEKYPLYSSVALFRDYVAFLLVCHRWCVVGSWAEAALFANALCGRMLRIGCWHKVMSRYQESFALWKSASGVWTLDAKNRWHWSWSNSEAEVQIQRFKWAAGEKLAAIEAMPDFEHFFFTEPLVTVRQTHLIDVEVIRTMIAPLPLLPLDRMCLYWRDQMFRGVYVSGGSDSCAQRTLAQPDLVKSPRCCPHCHHHPCLLLRWMWDLYVARVEFCRRVRLVMIPARTPEKKG